MIVEDAILRLGSVRAPSQPAFLVEMVTKMLTDCFYCAVPFCAHAGLGGGSIEAGQPVFRATAQIFVCPCLSDYG